MSAAGHKQVEPLGNVNGKALRSATIDLSQGPGLALSPRMFDEGWSKGVLSLGGEPDDWQNDHRPALVATTATGRSKEGEAPSFAIWVRCLVFAVSLAGSSSLVPLCPWGNSLSFGSNHVNSTGRYVEEGCVGHIVQLVQ